MSHIKHDTAPNVLRALGESIPNAIFFALDREFRYTFFNQKHAVVIEAIWGAKIHLGLNMLDVITKLDDREKAKWNFDQALAGQTVRLREEYGDEALLRSYWDNVYGPIYGDEGDVIGLFVQCIDVSEKMRSELIIEQQKAELERMIEERTEQLKEKVELIQELSAPIIPIWDGVLVVPIVGGLDEERGERVTNDVLTAIGRLSTREVLFDITGLRTVDANAAERLLRTISALRLLGAGCAVVGVRPDVARTLVEINAPLSGVPTFGTLRDGLRAALRTMAFEVVRRSK